MTPTEYFQIVGTTIALLFSVFAFFRSERMNQSYQKRQGSLDYEGFLHERMRDILEWGEKVILVMAEAEQLVEAKATNRRPDPEMIKSLMSRLSALVDVGRMFFPNYDHENRGVEKPFAYRGYRQRILDHCLRIHETLAIVNKKESPTRGDSHLLRVQKARRNFVSDLQIFIDPRRLKLSELVKIKAQVQEVYSTDKQKAE